MPLYDKDWFDAFSKEYSLCSTLFIGQIFGDTCYVPSIINYVQLGQSQRNIWEMDSLFLLQLFLLLQFKKYNSTNSESWVNWAIKTNLVTLWKLYICYLQSHKCLPKEIGIFCFSSNTFVSLANFSILRYLFLLIWQKQMLV